MGVWQKVGEWGEKEKKEGGWRGAPGVERGRNWCGNVG